MSILRPVYARNEAPSGVIFSARFLPQMPGNRSRFVGIAALATSTGHCRR